MGNDAVRLHDKTVNVTSNRYERLFNFLTYFAPIDTSFLTTAMTDEMLL